ncbi:triose-phosphate isomerase [Halobiforma lacisalsi AJ5]|uniref:Triose-phosphate isomerase n=1 Tax=Natronobacterium lacisalsi AJ5 TaxID=358396 RepID=M0LWN5_NATLA|nr:triose-phosphate isomerase [Halobiforma lacisalsi]APW97696.1 triose-phosphate isomerase [Halobiforma lacisalsi AJ5]EMA37558.1 triosephosphate isomerase [Halobiforma lacisalsi AJ5]
MGLSYPLFLVNLKTAEGTAGDDGLAVAETIDRVASETGRRFALAPQLPDLARVAERTDLPVVAQRAVRREEAGIGEVTCEAVAAAGADGVFVTHPGNRLPFSAVGPTLERCAELNLESIVWVESLEAARAALALEPGPDCLLFEQPDDIAAEEGTVRSRPERIAAFVEAVDGIAPETAVFVGGGVRTADDVARAFDCGVDATGAASAAVEALESGDLGPWLRSIAEAVPARLE